MGHILVATNSRGPAVGAWYERGAQVGVLAPGRPPEGATAPGPVGIPGSESRRRKGGARRERPPGPAQDPYSSERFYGFSAGSPRQSRSTRSSVFRTQGSLISSTERAQRTFPSWPLNSV